MHVIGSLKKQNKIVTKNNPSELRKGYFFEFNLTYFFTNDLLVEIPSEINTQT
jgi:hypothetical protein